MESVNRVLLQGYLGADPEVRVLESGVKVAQFRLATNENYFDKQGNKCEHTQWHHLVAWRAVADYVHRNFVKGSPVRVEGKIRSRTHTDRHTKANETIYEIVVNSAQLIVDNSIFATEAENPHQSRTSEPSFDIEPAPVSGDNLPF
ncbi:MAG: single-stranded DNA-binding protein [Rikenellaceae bacterium]